MTHASHWTASDGTQVHYRCDAERIVYANARHNVFDYLQERCVADALAFLQKHFPEERS